MGKKVRKTRGLRINNPLNIVKSAKPWVGEVLPGKDPEFCTFTSMAFGYRAAFITLNTYNRKHGIYSIRQIINRWCPPSDKRNNTQAYIKFVCMHMGVEPTHTIVVNAAYHDDIEEAKEFVKWMAYQEQGLDQDIDLKALEEGWVLAFQPPLP